MAIALFDKVRWTQCDRQIPRISQKGNIIVARKSSFLVSKRALTFFFFCTHKSCRLYRFGLCDARISIIILGLFNIAIAISLLGPLACILVLPVLPRLQADGQCIARTRPQKHNRGQNDLFRSLCYYQIIMFLHITLSSQLSDSRIFYGNNLIWARNIFKNRVVSLLTLVESCTHRHRWTVYLLAHKWIQHARQSTILRVWRPRGIKSRRFVFFVNLIIKFWHLIT